MTKSAQYIKIVKWSEQDQSYIGYCPGSHRSLLSRR